MNAHTPGPWFVEANQFGRETYFDVFAPIKDTQRADDVYLEAPEDAQLVARVEVADDGSVARLIAAAPDLLAALEFCVQAIRTAGLETVPGGICAQAAEEARAAIAKARGGQ